MYESFGHHRIATAGAEINAVTAGTGPPVLLLHGYPQDLAVWHRVAPALAADYTVVAADLRGYGRSSIPATDDNHAPYSFRSMAADQVEVMRALGHGAFAVVGHDRGARVAHRMALDHPEVVQRLAVLDIVPTRHVLETVDARLATRYYHWFFLVQPEVPERLIGLDPMYYLHTSLGSLGSAHGIQPPETLRSYEQAFADPARRQAMLEDYRAAATIDQVHDRQDASRKLPMPVLALWAVKGVVHELYEPLQIWRAYADDVRGRPVDAGHFLVDELPLEITEELRAFLPR
jgi:haloacetate dehalogenase